MLTMIQCPNHAGAFDCSPFCKLCAGEQEIQTELKIIEYTKPTEQAKLTDGRRLAIWPELGAIELTEIIGDLASYQTIEIARNFKDISTNDEHREPIAEILEQYKRGNIADYEVAIAKHLERANMDFRFLSLRGYSPSEWAEIVLYAPKNLFENLTAVSNDIKGWFAGDIYTVTLDTLKLFVAQDGEIRAEWQTEDSLSLIVFSESYGYKNGLVDWETIAQDCFGMVAK